ncbi:hypothetical protein [Streptomyces iakyrus]|jgi:hypothetical protein|uniref:hypothetical protein n=1 Tax=Streptomyces iakyrus TaxID=68219 RepID=UPI003D8EF61B
MITIVCLALMAACTAPGPGPRITPAPLSPYSANPSPTSAAPKAASLGTAPPDLHDLDWARARIPGDFCDISEAVTLGSYETTAKSRTYGTVHVYRVGEEVQYGNVTGDARSEAALPVGCDNGGGTAAGQLAFGIIVFQSDAGQLKSLGTVTARHNPENAPHVTLLGDIDLALGKATVEEKWYRPSDANCCPTGTAVTVWTLQDDGTLTAGPPRITA